MLTGPVIDMADACVEQQKGANVKGMDFDDRFGLLIDAEWLLRQNPRTKRRMKEAKLRLTQACIEDVDTGAARLHR